MSDLSTVLERRLAREKSARQEAELLLERKSLELYRNNLELKSELTERGRIEAALFAEKERAQVTLESIRDAVITTDLSGRVEYLNPVAEALTGWSKEGAAGHALNEVYRVVQGVTREPEALSLDQLLRPDRGATDDDDLILVGRDGTEFAINHSAAPIRDRSGAIAGTVLVFRDVTEARRMAEQIRRLAHHDPLTNLPNRILLFDRARQAIARARRDGNVAALLFLDLDRFKHVNDSLGHDIGDRLLLQVTERLTQCVRRSDTVSRQGGDEFVVLLPTVADPDASHVAEKLLAALAAPFDIEGHLLHMSVSIGISVFPGDGEDVETLIKHADTAMYHAKESGRNTYRSFVPQMNLRAVERLSLENSMRQALANGEFRLHYQPQVDLRSGRIVGAEALIRWERPDGESVAPARFIPIAEECGLIAPIGQWVLREACAQNRAWQAAGLPAIPVAVNISALQFQRADFLDVVRDALSRSGLESRFLELELTEGVIMQGAETTIARLKAVKSMGLQLSVDDFGTGYSSLSYLKRFPIDALKIDRAFVRDLGTEMDDGAITRAIISMGRSLRLRVIAEGVETETQKRFLTAHGCDEMQGYYLSRPVPPAEFAALLEIHGGAARAQTA